VIGATIFSIFQPIDFRGIFSSPAPLLNRF